MKYPRIKALLKDGEMVRVDAIILNNMAVPADKNGRSACIGIVDEHNDSHLFAEVECLLFFGNDIAVLHDIPPYPDNDD